MIGPVLPTVSLSRAPDVHDQLAAARPPRPLGLPQVTRIGYGTLEQKTMQRNLLWIQGLLITQSGRNASTRREGNQDLVCGLELRTLSLLLVCIWRLALSALLWMWQAVYGFAIAHVFMYQGSSCMKRLSQFSLGLYSSSQRLADSKSSLPLS